MNKLRSPANKLPRNKSSSRSRGRQQKGAASPRSSNTTTSTASRVIVTNEARSRGNPAERSPLPQKSPVRLVKQAIKACTVVATGLGVIRRLGLTPEAVLTALVVALLLAIALEAVQRFLERGNKRPPLFAVVVGWTLTALFCLIAVVFVFRFIDAERTPPNYPGTSKVGGVVRPLTDLTESEVGH